MVRTLYYARRYEQAVDEAHKAELLDPDYPRTHFWLGRVYAQMGKFSEAIAEAERSGPTDSVIRLTELAYAHAWAGETAKANAVLQSCSSELSLPTFRLTISPLSILPWAKTNRLSHGCKKPTPNTTGPWLFSVLSLASILYAPTPVSDPYSEKLASSNPESL